MRVTFVTSYLSAAGGGVAAATAGLSAALARSGATMSVLGLSDRQWQAGDGNWAGAQAVACDVHGPGSYGYAKDLGRRLRASAPDVVHTHGLWMHPSACVGHWGQATGSPYIVSPHGMLDLWAVKQSGWKKRIAGMLYEGAHLRRAACLHALCDAEVDAMRAFGLTNQICVVPNGVELPDAGETLEAPPWRGRFPPASRVLLYLGRLHPKKNLHGLMAALAFVRDRHGGLGAWHVAVGGWDQDGYGEKLSASLEGLGLAGRVSFLGPLHGKQKASALRHATAFILPSLSEGQPMAVLEAWSHGLPVAMTRACNLADGFKVGAAHEISQQSNAMADDLARFLARDTDALAAMGEAGRRHARASYSWTNAARELLDVYAWLLGRGARPACVRTDVAHRAS